MRVLRSFLVVLGLAVFAGAVLAEEVGHITVSGEGRAIAVPDMAVITLGATAQSDTAKAAMDETSRITAAILAQFEGFEIAARDIQTSDLSLNPVWNHSVDTTGTPQIVAYQASNRITVRVRDLARLGAILDAALSDGANRLGGLQFTLADPKPHLDAARRDAVRDAREKAALYAEAAGVGLGRLVSLSESGHRMPRPEMMSLARAADSAVPVAEGETELSTGVTLVFEIATP